MRRLAVASMIMLAALVTAAPAPAETGEAAQAKVEAQAANLGVALNEAQAVQDQAALMPAVKQAVKAGARESLLHSTNPNVLSDALRFVKPKVKLRHSSKPKPGNAPASIARHRVRAHSAGCWGSVYNMVQWGSVAWLYVRENGWCGDGYSIYWYGGATFAEWAWGPYCFTGRGNDYSWDVYPSWIHTAIWGEAGVTYVWGCFGISGGKAQVRFAANGYWDLYNDYGF